MQLIATDGVVWLVCLSVGHICDPCKNGRNYQDSIWGGGWLSGSKESCITWCLTESICSRICLNLSLQEMSRRLCLISKLEFKSTNYGLDTCLWLDLSTASLAITWSTWKLRYYKWQQLTRVLVLIRTISYVLCGQRCQEHLSAWWQSTLVQRRQNCVGSAAVTTRSSLTPSGGSADNCPANPIPRYETWSTWNAFWLIWCRIRRTRCKWWLSTTSVQVFRLPLLWPPVKMVRHCSSCEQNITRLHHIDSWC